VFLIRTARGDLPEACALLTRSASRAISSTWRSPITPQAGGNLAHRRVSTVDARWLASLRGTPTPGLPPARGVIALWEVVRPSRISYGEVRIRRDDGDSLNAQPGPPSPTERAKVGSRH
jgi:hypothetical protein